MFNQARGFFGLDPESVSVTEAAAGELRTALAVVLIHAATADGTTDIRELQAISRALQAKLNLPPDKVDLLLQRSIADTDHRMLQQALAEINENFSPEHREQLLALAWSVLQADGKLGQEEGSFAAQLREQLRLSPEQGIRARMHANNVQIDGFKEFVEASKELTNSVKNWVNERPERK